MAAGRPVFLSADEFYSGELPKTALSKESNNLWRLPTDLEPNSLLESSLHNEGSYGLFVCESKSNIERLPDLPWWGHRAAAVRILDGLRQAGIELALVVHPDASDWMVAIPEDDVPDTT